MSLVPELVDAAGAELGEGPVAEADGSVRWVDIPNGTVFRHSPAVGGEVLHRYTSEVSKCLKTTDGWAVLGSEGVSWEDEQGTEIAFTRLIDPTEDCRCSDGTVLPDGSLVVGVVDRELREGRGRLVRIRALSAPSVVVSTTTISNGISVDAAGERAYYTDSPTQRIDVFDIDASGGDLIDRRPFAVIPDDMGVPDGLCTDVDGGVWVALWGGGRVVRLDHHGRIDVVIELPVPHVTSCAFAGPTNNELYVTTAAALLNSSQREEMPGAGGLWCVRLDVRGVTVPLARSARQQNGAGTP